VETLHYHIEIFILKNFQSFNLFSFFAMGQSKWFIKNTKSYMSNEICGKDFNLETPSFYCCVCIHGFLIVKL